MPLPDNYDLWCRHEDELEAELERCPVCCECDEHIQDEACWDINGDLYCEECAKDKFRKWTEDYMD